MSKRALTRRELIAGGMTLGAASLPAARVGTTSAGGGGGAASTGAVTLQNSIQGADPKAALEALVKAYPGGDGWPDGAPYRSIGVEPLLGAETNLDRAARDRLAYLDGGGQIAPGQKGG
jgi:hypothetical protein